MNRILPAVIFGLSCCPAWAVVDCWRGNTVTVMATKADLVVTGVITGIEQSGCRYPDGSVKPCTTELGVPLPDRAMRVQFQVRKVLKGIVGKTLEFDLFMPMVLVGCKGPDLELYTSTLAFLRQEEGKFVAWDGDDALCQRTRWNYADLVKKTKAALEQTTSP
jgi:hypothetical protein